MSKSYSNFRTLFGRNNVFPSPKESFQPFLRKDVFPIKCKNIFCGEEYNEDDFLWAIGERGLVYADSQEIIFQGFNCPRCNKTTLIKMPASNPVVDLRKFILVPDVDTLGEELLRQLYEFIRHHLQDSPLKYNFIPVWDTEQADFNEIFAYVFRTEKFQDTYAPEDWLQDYIYFMSIDEVANRLSIENSMGTIMLKRLLPDSEFSRHLCVLLTPFPKLDEKASKDESINNIVNNNSYYNPLLSNSTYYFFEKKSIESILYRLYFRLKTSGLPISSSQMTKYESMISHEFHCASLKLSKQMLTLSKNVDFMDSIYKVASQVYKSFENNTFNLIALSEPRKKLSSWIEKAKDDGVLFVDAPMGAGKTYSIVKALSDDLKISAVIFFPTKRLCQEIEFKLKNAIAWKLGLYPIDNSEDTEYYRSRYEEDNHFEEHFTKTDRFKTQYLKKHVYYLDGINEQECPFYDDIIGQYKNRWYQKKKFCLKCPNNNSCRFFHHFESAKKSRIVITTHQQYLNFFNNENNWYWIDEKPDAKEMKRDLFIIDEDLVLKICYSPIELSMKELKSFYATITEFVRDNFYNRPFYKETIDNIDKLYAQHNKSDTTVLIPPVNPDFKMPNEIKEKWQDICSENKNLEIIPDFIDWNRPLPNLLDLVEHAIRNGFIIQDYKTNISSHDSQQKLHIKKVLYPNPTTLVFDGQPSHVIFDGTMLQEKFLKFKMKNINFDKLSIDIQPIWRYEIKQNINTDLPKNKVSKLQKKIKKYVKDILETNGKKKDYFIVTSKTIRENYLEPYLRNQFHDYYLVFGHYGNLRGINDAQDCDVCIMLGGFDPSDAVEIAMAIEFIKDKLKQDKILATYGNLWAWSKTNSIRKYHDEFSVIEELAHAFKFSEYKQALARTRYISHDTKFYIILKNSVNEFETFLPKPITLQDRADLFQSRKQPSHKGKKHEEIKRDILDWLRKHEKVTATDIHEEYGHRRQTVGNSLKMMDELVLKEGYKTTYKLREN